MQIKPLFDRVVVKKVENEETTKSGIVLLAKDQEKPQMAEVVAVGPGGLVDGNDVEMVVCVGDRILYSKYAGSDFKIDGVEVTIMRQGDILAVLEK